MSMRPATRTASDQARPPREITGRMVFVCVVTFFAVVTAVNAVMIRAAVSTFGGLETDSSYKAGLAFAREIAAADAQGRQHWNVTATLGAMIDGQLQLDLVALDAAGRPVSGQNAHVRLSHPTDRRHDHDLDLNPVGPGRFAGQVSAAPGQWDLVIELSRDGERTFLSRRRIVVSDARPR